MTVENIVMALTFISSAIALYFSTRKQKHEEANVDADTIGKLYDLIDRQETRYQELKQKLDEIQAEVEILRGEKKAREDTIENLKRENAELTAQVEKLQAAIGRRDKRIRELEKQVAELKARMDAVGNEEG